MTNRARLFVTLEGYAVEGGFDRPGEVMTCYAPTIALDRHAGPGAADDLWRSYEKVVDFVPALGFEGLRLTLEWARVEPRDGEVDDAALRRYGEVIRHARSLGLDVTIALVDAVWPSWLGQEAWLLPWVVPYVLRHARRVVDTFDNELTGLVAFTQPTDLVTRGFLTASAPPWRRSALTDAGFAHAQIDAIVTALQGDDVVGPRLVGATTVLALDDVREDLASLREPSDLQEIYVRSLLRGRGPTSVATGLLVQHGDEWRVSADEELLSALR